MKYKYLLVFIVAFLFLTGCAKSISDIKNEDYIGKKVVVKGTATGTIKIGKLSGYTLVDNEGSKIGISTQKLPSEGDEVTVKGILMKDTLFGYYVKAN